MKPHKHAELIKAWADGAKIQYYCPGKNKWIDSSRPDWWNNIEYRIKPELKPDVVEYMGFHIESSCGEFGDDKLKKIAAMSDRKLSIVDNWCNVLKLTFDGETGKLKNAEVIK